MAIDDTDETDDTEGIASPGGAVSEDGARPWPLPWTRAPRNVRPSAHAGRHRGYVRRCNGTNPWYGTDIGFQRALEAGLSDELEHIRAVTVRLADSSRSARLGGTRVLVYEHAGLDVPARRDPVPVRIEFHERPNYSTYGLPAADYPRVFADPGAISKHRLPGDTLCLWFPRDPDDRRWHAADGLLTLLNNVRNHLFFEDHWRATGGFGGPGRPGGTWLGDEAPHGFPDAEGLHAAGQEDVA